MLLLHPTEDMTPSPLSVSRILMPLDGSPLAEEALPVAEQLASLLHSPVKLLEVVVPLYFYGDFDVSWDYAYPNYLLDFENQARAYLAGRARMLRERTITVESKVMTGSPAAAITAAAEAEPGTLIVMASHGRSGVVGALLGSIARQVVRQRGTPVLVVRPPIRSPLADQAESA